MSRTNNGKSPAPVFLVGFMGVGKTTAGRRLAESLSLRFFDLDLLIEEQAGRSVKEIFADFGEPHFRELESAAIRSCADLTGSIIALGGGAYVNETNRAVLRSIGKTVWLDCPLEICLSRIALDGSRPLAADEKTMRSLMESRKAAYSQADFHIQTGDKAPDQVARELVEVLRQAGVL